MLVSVAFSIAFIARSAFVVDGLTYFSLFDDAMISMRYARNLAEGMGLVWNPQAPPVEGYSNLLWTLWMAVLHGLGFSESLVSLAVMVTGAILLAVNVVVVGLLARRLVHGRLPILLAMGMTALYYPLVFWTLRGMEVGLLTVLLTSSTWIGLEIRRDPRAARIVALCGLLVLAVLTRDDASLPAAVIATWVMAALPHGRRRRVGAALAVSVGLALIGIAAFRLSYYGDLLPNTYYLKLSGTPPSDRLGRGMRGLSQVFVAHLFVLVVASAIPFVGRRELARERLLPWLLAGSAVGYSIYVGGDAWEWMLYSNRYITPVVPLLLVLASAGLCQLARSAPSGRIALLCLLACAVALSCAVLERTAGPNLDAGLAQATAPMGAMVVVALWLALSYLVRRLPAQGRLRGRVLPATFAALLLGTLDWVPVSHWISENGHRVAEDASLARTGLALRSALGARASIAVVPAGAIPYFSRAPSIDLLGKSDPVIARLPSRTPFYPGHSKWDYGYSLGRLHPDVVHGPWAPNETMAEAARATFTKLGYEPFMAGLWVRRASQLDLEALRRELIRCKRR